METPKPDCDLCGEVGIHDVTVVDEKRMTKKKLDLRLDKNVLLKNFQHKHYARKSVKEVIKDKKEHEREINDHFVFGQNVSEMKPSKIANALLKRDAEKFYNLQFQGETIIKLSKKIAGHESQISFDFQINVHSL